MHERLSRMEGLLGDEVSAEFTYLDLDHDYTGKCRCPL